jgi:hypothetical protein
MKLIVALALLLATLCAPLVSHAQQAGTFYAPPSSQTVSWPVSNLVVAPGQHKLMTFEVNADATLSGAPWWICIYDATSLPANGAAVPTKSYELASGTTQAGATFDTDGPRFLTGIVIGVSTTTCTNLTASAHALFIAADYQ